MGLFSSHSLIASNQLNVLQIVNSKNRPRPCSFTIGKFFAQKQKEKKKEGKKEKIPVKIKRARDIRMEQSEVKKK